MLVARRVVARLGLQADALLLLGALFGTELWFYSVIEPSYAHAVDALAFSTAAYLVVRVWQGASPAFAWALGAVLVGLVTIRYANVAALPGLLLPVPLLRCRRTAARVLGGALVGAVLLLLPPLVRGTGFGGSADVRWKPGTGSLTSQTPGESLSNLLVPLRMLLSPERGLFPVAPLCAVALLGLVLAVRRPGPHVVPVISLCLAGLGILLAYVAVGGDWRGGGYSYGQRFLTSLTVITLIGLAELRRRVPRATSVIVVLCTAWSLFFGLNYAYGWTGVTNETRNPDDIVRLYTSGERSPWEFVRLVAYRLHTRFAG